MTKWNKCVVDNVRALSTPTTTRNGDNRVFLMLHLWVGGRLAFRSARQFNAVRVGQDKGRKI